MKRVTVAKGAPNVVIILIDDIGFGDSSAFGGPISMPTLEKLANGGLRHGETNVSPDYKQGDNAFTGKIVKVTVVQK